MSRRFPYLRANSLHYPITGAQNNQGQEAQSRIAQAIPKETHPKVKGIAMILKCTKCGSLSQDFQGANDKTRYTCSSCVHLPVDMAQIREWRLEMQDRDRAGALWMAVQILREIEWDRERFKLPPLEGLTWKARLCVRCCEGHSRYESLNGTDEWTRFIQRNFTPKPSDMARVLYRETLVSLPVKWKGPEARNWAGPKMGKWAGEKAHSRSKLESEANRLLKAAKEREGSGDGLPSGEDDMADMAAVVNQWREDFARQRRDDSRGLAIELIRIFGDESKLSSQERAVWRMFSVEGHSVREIEKATGVSKSNVSALAEKAKLKLARSVNRARKSAGLTDEQLRIINEMSHFCGEDELDQDDAAIENNRRDSITEHWHSDHDE